MSEIPYDLIISDMGRPSGQRAGYKLLSKSKRIKGQAQFIIYAGSSTSRDKQEAIRLGATGHTDNPHELFEMIMVATSHLPKRQ